MIEQEWKMCADPQKMLEFLKGKASDRKLRLFAVACCRRIWHLLTDERSRNAVDNAEKFAEGTVSSAVRHEAARRAHDVALTCTDRPIDPKTSAAFAAVYAAEGFNDELAHYHDRGVYGTFEAAIDTLANCKENEHQFMAFVVRNIFGIPFRPISLNPAWLSPTVLNLATSIYTDKAFEKMPFLGDALEDAGCDNQDILGHCRKPGVHVKGCWVVDLMLGK